ncbi:MAG TPA: methyltransferase domain-containing protein [Candidatus Bathyarchaeia archaeon]|nr:methyltransferase domain-containing protein [Candidatus Bathyarchaeia archaeon]
MPGTKSTAQGGMRQLLRNATQRPRVPQRLRDRFRPLTPEIRHAVEQSLRGSFFADKSVQGAVSDSYLATPEGQADLESHVAGRLELFRLWPIPWLDSLLKLEGARILEIGCGTGASTVALAEQGAQVVGLDVSGATLAAARDRFAAFGLKADFVESNATTIASQFAGQKFDAILFFAVVEHLTWDERIRCLKAAWDLLPANGMLAVIEAPNRLWYVDIHTTNEPFYNWLPDETAIAYTRYIGGPSRHLFAEPAEEAKLQLARLGRGVSYHDFVIAWNIPPEKLSVAGYLAEFHETKWHSLLAPLSSGGRYRKLLSSAAPGLHPAFLQPSLDLAFRKPGS